MSVLTDEIVEGIGRVYTTPDGIRYPSVTTILNEHSRQGIDAWKIRVGEDVARAESNKGKRRGTKFHQLAEKYLLGETLPELNVFEEAVFKRFLPIFDRISNIRHVEVGLYSHYLRTAGRCDLVADFDSRLSVIDFKSSKARKLSEWVQVHYMQTSAYAVMYEEQYKVPIQKLTILIAPDHDWPQVFVSKRDEWIRHFMHYRDRFELQFGRL